MASASLKGVQANLVVLDERQLTRRVDENDVKRTFDEFQSRVTDSDTGVDAELIISTTEKTEARATDLLDLGEAALARLFGSDAQTDVSVITAQDSVSARLRVSKAGLMRTAAAMGLGTLASVDLENFIAQRVSTEYQLLLLKFADTDLVPTVDLTLELLPSGRSLTVSRAQRFR